MITKEEYEILKQYRAEGYSYLSRDKDNLLCVNMYKPRKLNERWLWGTKHLLLNRDTLKCVRWEDEKPTKINDLIRDYESHMVITEGNNLNKAELIKEIEDEPLYYALIKGHELSSNKFKYWSCNAYDSGDLFIGSKHPKARCINRMTKNNWNKFGISSSNADFVAE